LNENLGATFIELSTEDLNDIEQAASAIKVQGARYPDQMEKMTGL
jgi:hypothetical protein